MAQNLASDPRRLGKILLASENQFQHSRNARRQMQMQAVGRFYRQVILGEEEHHKAAPINLLATAINTFVPNLIFNNPQVSVQSRTLLYRNYAELLALATNHTLKQIRFRQTLRKVVTDSLFMAGFLKTGLATTSEYITIDGNDVEIGQPYAERIDPDDIFLDPMARDWDEQNLVGHRMRVSMDDLHRMPDLNHKLFDKLNSRYEESSVLQRTEALSKGNRLDGLQVDELYDYVDVAEVYLPQEGVVALMPYNSKGAAPEEFLRVTEYEGPDNPAGPYHMLGYQYVPDNVLPVPPASLWYDLHILSNRIARKIARQAERNKRVLAYESTAADDVAAIVESEDGNAIKVDNLDQIKELNYGGTTEDAYVYQQWLKGEFSEQSNNVDRLGGANDDAQTATQAQILQANSNIKLSDAKSQVAHFTSEVARDIGFTLHNDPFIDLPLIRRTRGKEAQVHYTAEQKKGDFLDYEFEYVPYSMEHVDPRLKVRQMLEGATTVIPAAAQATQLLGPAFKTDAFIARVFKEMNIHDADEWFDAEEYKDWASEQAVSKLEPGKASKYTQSDSPSGTASKLGQPLPSQMGPTGGVSPQAETRSVQQQAAPQPADRGA